VKAAANLSRPYVVTTHGTWQLLAGDSRLGRWREVFKRGLWASMAHWPGLLRGAGAVIALNAVEEHDAAEAGVSLSRIRRIPNAVDLDMFPLAGPLTGDEDIPPRNKGVILFAGSIEENKGVFEAISAAIMLRTTHPEARWLFCGDGPDRKRAESLAKKEGLDDSVVFLGRIPRVEMPELYRRADLVVVPSRSEACATVLLEAMASGIPCLGTNVGGTPEIIKDYQTGFLVPPRDSRALAEMAGWLMEHPLEARAFGKAGRVRAEKEFAWPKVAARIEESYRLALAMSIVLVFLAIFRPAMAVELAPVDILTMVDPVNGQSLSQGDMEWRLANPAWDGRSICLSAARGETAAFQVMFIPEPGERLTDIRIQLDLAGSPWRAYRAWHIWNVPEVAVPLGEGAPVFDLPSCVPGELEATRGFRAFSTVVEVSVARDTQAGRLDGTLSVSWKGGSRQLPVQLAVRPFALPERPRFTLEMNSYGDYLRFLPGSPEMFLDIHRLFRNFRCTFTLVPYRQDGATLLNFLAPTLDSGGRLDFTAFDQALAGLFDGEAFPDHQPLGHFILPLQANWPAPYGLAQIEYAALNVTARRALAKHILAKGWAATRFQEFHNENPEHGARAPWRLDEPVSTRDMAGHQGFLSYLGQVCQDLIPNCPLHYRIDISGWRSLRPSIQALKGQVSDWSISADPQFLDDETVHFFRELGGQWLLAYGELDGFQSHGRPTPWTKYPLRLARIYLLGMDGFAQWQVDHWQTRENTGLPAQLAPLFASNAAGARDFIWPGNALGLDGPMPSLRLFALREGLNMLDYLSLVRDRHPEKAEELRRRLAALNPTSASDMYAFKAQLSEMLVM
jgi:hypothetical protein